jgi:(2Fe-2S) ferredoxin
MHALVDGHNALFRLAIRAATPEEARRELLRRVAAVSRDATVFFDAMGAPLSAPGVDRDGGLEVHYCRGTEADEVILAAVRAAARPETLIVVSDDRELTGRARQLGARVSGVAAWLEPGVAPAPSAGRPTPAGGAPLTAADFGLPPVIDLKSAGGWLESGTGASPGGGPPAPPAARPAAPGAGPVALPPGPRPEGRARAEELVAKLATAAPKRHILLCAEPTKAKCADAAVGREVWEHLKRRTKELGLDALKPPDDGPHAACVLRTKVDCLRVCAEGPICVVYPEGVWYRGVTVEVMERILLEHVLGGRVVRENVLGSAPLPPAGKR